MVYASILDVRDDEARLHLIYLICMMIQVIPLIMIIFAGGALVNSNQKLSM